MLRFTPCRHHTHAPHALFARWRPYMLTGIQPKSSTLRAALGDKTVSRDQIKAHLASKFDADKVNASLAAFVAGGFIKKTGDDFTMNNAVTLRCREGLAHAANWCAVLCACVCCHPGLHVDARAWPLD